MDTIGILGFASSGCAGRYRSTYLKSRRTPEQCLVFGGNLSSPRMLCYNIKPVTITSKGLLCSTLTEENLWNCPPSFKRF